MPGFSASSTTSPDCRVELGPSRALAVALLLLGLCAGGALALTELGRPLVLLLAPACVGWGALLARAEQRRGANALVLRADGTAWLDGDRLHGFRIEEQAPFVRLSWQTCGRRHRFVAWPDVVDAGARRELRLWAARHRADAATAAVAP